MVWDIFELKTQNQNPSFKKNSSIIMLSDSWTSAFKMAWEDPQKNIDRKYKKTGNCPASLAISEALTIQHTRQPWVSVTGSVN